MIEKVALLFLVVILNGTLQIENTYVIIIVANKYFFLQANFIF